MADYFEKFGTTTAKVVAWAGPLGFAVTDEAIAAANAREAPRPAPAKPLTTAELRAKVDLKKYAKARDLKSGAFGSTSLLASKTPGDPLLVAKTPSGIGSRDELVKEARMYEKAGDHPNIAKCLGMQNVNGRECLVLEGIPGKDVAGTSEALRAKYESGKISHEQFWGATQHMLASMLKAATHLESKGIVHNDLRLDNVMCDATTGDVKVIDFGISVDSGAGEKTGVAPWGYGTVSPEFARGLMMSQPPGSQGPREATMDPKHDVFAVGATAYHMGEQGKFRYHDESLPEQGNIPAPTIAMFAAPDKDGKMKQAIRNVPPPKPTEDGSPPPASPEEASKVVDGKREKKRGLAAAQTEYTKFVNWLMTPVNGRRPTAAMALQHPFITDSILDEESAKGAIRAALAPDKPKPAPAPPPAPVPAPVARSAAQPGEPSHYAIPEGVSQQPESAPQPTRSAAPAPQPVAQHPPLDDGRYTMVAEHPKQSHAMPHAGEAEESADDEPEEDSDVEDSEGDEPEEDSDVEEDSEVEDVVDDEAHGEAAHAGPPPREEGEHAASGHPGSDALRGAAPGRGSYDMLDPPPAQNQSGDSHYDMLDPPPGDEPVAAQPHQPARGGHPDSDALRGDALPGQGGYDMLDEPEK